MKNNFSDRDRKNYKRCIYHNYLYYPYVKVDGICSLTNIKVRHNTGKYEGGYNETF